MSQQDRQEKNVHRYHHHQGADVVGGGDDAGLGGLQVEPPLDAGDDHVDQAVDAHALHGGCQGEEDQEPLGAPEPVEEGEWETARGAIGDHVIGRRACGAFRGGLELKGVGQTWWTLLVILNTWNGG